MSRTGNPFTVLMLCSLQSHKEIMLFVECAASLPGLRFELVLETSKADIGAFFSGVQLPPNFYLYEWQDDTHPFYERASTVLSPAAARVLEAMYHSRPVIVPPVGDAADLVEDGCEGFHVNNSRLECLITAICLLVENNDIHSRMSQAAYRKALFLSR